MSVENNDYRHNPPAWRAWLHIAMGIIYLLFAFIAFYVKRFGSIELSETAVYGMSGLLSLYGIFRLWRGITDLRANRNQQ